MFIRSFLFIKSKKRSQITLRKKYLTHINEMFKEVKLTSGMAGSRLTPSLGPVVCCVGFIHRKSFSSILGFLILVASESVSFPLVPIKVPDWLSLVLLRSRAHP